MNPTYPYMYRFKFHHVHSFQLNRSTCTPRRSLVPPRSQRTSALSVVRPFHDASFWQHDGFSSYPYQPKSRNTSLIWTNKPSLPYTVRCIDCRHRTLHPLYILGLCIFSWFSAFIPNSHAFRIGLFLDSLVWYLPYIGNSTKLVKLHTGAVVRTVCMLASLDI